MRYTIETIIAQPIEKVIELFENPDNLAKWQPGFVGIEHISGEAGKAGAISKLTYLMGKRKIEMKETILENTLPNKFIAIYEAKGVWNKIANEFEAINTNSTKYSTQNEFVFKGFMKLISWLMPSAFKKQSCKYQEQFKAFAEGEM